MVSLFLAGALIVPVSAVLAQDALPPAETPAIPANLPKIPKGKSTVIGGEIRRVDSVRDQFQLKVFGVGKPVKIWYDERTQVYRDGVKISELKLMPDDHASVETVLDGQSVFALRVHLLTSLPEGETKGQVLSYDPQTGDLRMTVTASKDSFGVHVGSGTTIVRAGQLAAGGPGSRSDLGKGTLVDVKFKGGKNGHGEATHVDVIAIVGSSFVFRGDLTALDVKSGRMIVSDAVNGQTQSILFNPALFPVSRDLHEGSPVRVTARFDGTKYVANEISVD